MIQLTKQPLNSQNITQSVSKDTNGGVVTFLGTTRLFNHGKRVLYLEYEAYWDMATKKLEEIRQEVQRLWEIKDIAIAHRVGRLEIGEVSLVVAVASPHRKEAFEACQYVVDQLKRKVPIWKKEVFEGGYVWIGSQNREHTSVTLDN